MEKKKKKKKKKLTYFLKEGGHEYMLSLTCFNNTILIKTYPDKIHILTMIFMCFINRFT
jgi:hypothetical protein